MTYAVDAADANQPGTILIVTSGQAHPGNWVGVETEAVRPAHVAASIREAQDHGWDPTRVGSPCYWDEEDTWFFFEVDSEGRVIRQVELEG